MRSINTVLNDIGSPECPSSSSSHGAVDVSPWGREHRAHPLRSNLTPWDLPRRHPTSFMSTDIGFKDESAPLCDDLDDGVLRKTESCFSTCGKVENHRECPDRVIEDGLRFQKDPFCKSHMECIGKEDRALCTATKAALGDSSETLSTLTVEWGRGQVDDAIRKDDMDWGRPQNDDEIRRDDIKNDERERNVNVNQEARDRKTPRTPERQKSSRDEHGSIGDHDQGDDKENQDSNIPETDRRIPPQQPTDEKIPLQEQQPFDHKKPLSSLDIKYADDVEDDEDVEDNGFDEDELDFEVYNDSFNAGTQDRSRPGSTDSYNPLTGKTHIQMGLSSPPFVGTTHIPMGISSFPIIGSTSFTLPGRPRAEPHHAARQSDLQGLCKSTDASAMPLFRHVNKPTTTLQNRAIIAQKMLRRLQHANSLGIESTTSGGLVSIGDEDEFGSDSDVSSEGSLNSDETNNSKGSYDSDNRQDSYDSDRILHNDGQVIRSEISKISVNATSTTSIKTPAEETCNASAIGGNEIAIESAKNSVKNNANCSPDAVTQLCSNLSSLFAAGSSSIQASKAELASLINASMGTTGRKGHGKGNANGKSDVNTLRMAPNAIERSYRQALNRARMVFRVASPCVNSTWSKHRHTLAVIPEGEEKEDELVDFSEAMEEVLYKHKRKSMRLLSHEEDEDDFEKGDLRKCEGGSKNSKSSDDEEGLLVFYKDEYLLEMANWISTTVTKNHQTLRTLLKDPKFKLGLLIGDSSFSPSGETEQEVENLTNIVLNLENQLKTTVNTPNSEKSPVNAGSMQDDEDGSDEKLLVESDDDEEETRETKNAIDKQKKETYKNFF